MSKTETMASSARAGKPAGSRPTGRSARSATSGGDTGSASAQANAAYDPWGRSLLQAARRLWWLPVTLAVLGGLAGGLVGSVAQPSAQALVRVQASPEDGDALARAVQTSAQELDTTALFDAAGALSNTTGADLRSRTQIAPVSESQVLTITVTAPTLDAAVLQANAVVEAGVQQAINRLDGEVAEITRQTRNLITQSKLSDAEAEQARVASLGDGLATAQSELIANSRTLTVLAPASSSSQTPQAALLGAMGLLGGALAGLAMALLLGGRRGRVNSVKELRRLYPQVPVVEQDELASLVGMEASRTSTWVVGGLEGPGEDLQPLVDVLSAQLAAAGLDVHHSDSLSVLRERRGNRLASTSEVAIVTTPLNQAIARSVERDEEASLLLVVQPRHTRHEWLDQYAATFGDHTFLVVTQPQSQWKW